MKVSWEGDGEYEGSTSTTKTFSVKEKASNGGQGIPGFPWESILVGMVIGFGVIFLLKRKKTVPVNSLTLASYASAIINI